MDHAVGPRNAVARSTLIAESFAETFTLTGQDLAECVKQSRGCRWDDHC